MSEPAILFVKPGSVRPSDKARLTKIGVCVVEVEYPADVKFITPGRDLSHSDLLGAAAEAIGTDSTGWIKRAFSDAVCVAIANQKKQP